MQAVQEGQLRVGGLSDAPALSVRRFLPEDQEEFEEVDRRGRWRSCRRDT